MTSNYPRTNMNALRWECDAVASDAVDSLQSRSGDSGDLYSRLENLHASDPALEQIWKLIRTVPPWVDWEQVRRGQLVLKRYAIPIIIGFAFQGFAGEIAAALGPAEVLIRTGGLSERNIIARMEATLRWLVDVTESPESLRADGPGFVSTIRVRLRHAAVRRRILDIPKSHPAFLDPSLHGVPINTYDSILTLTFFCCNPIWKQLPRLGIYLATQETEDFVALYRFLAHLLGVPSEHFSSVTRAKKTMEDMKDGNSIPSESSRKITRAFINTFADKAPYNVSRGLIQAGIRKMNPAPVCDALGLEAIGWTSYAAFLGLQWSVGLVALVRKVGFPLPPDNVAIERICKYFPPCETSIRQAQEGEVTCGFKYESAFPHRRSKEAKAGQLRRRGMFAVKRPVEVLLLTAFGTLLLLATVLAVAAVNLLMASIS